MKITVYSMKGSAGKTPIATNIALDREYALGTNELYHVFEGFIPEERLLAIEPDDAFPQIPDDVDIVFDLAGSLSKGTPSIRSAIEQSDLVIVPIYNEVKSLNAGIHTILEVAHFTQNILVIATKLQKKKRKGNQPEIFLDWKDSKDCQNIAETVQKNVDFPVPILPLKSSNAFDALFEKERSLQQMCLDDPLLAHSYREVVRQFNAIYHFIDQKHAQ